MGNGIRLGNQIINQNGAPSINENTLANRPAAGQVGRLFVDTTNNILYRDNGTSWDQIGSTSTTPNLQAVCAVGNTYTGDAYFNSIRIGHGGPTSVATNTLVGQAGLNSVAFSYASQNSAFGRDALTNLTGGSSNTAIGYQAGYTLTTSGQNTFIGNQAGYYTTGLGNVIIGNGADTGTSSFPTLGAGSNTIIGAGFIGSSINQYSSYNNFIGYGTASGYTGNGINGLNTIIGSLLSVSATPTLTGNIILGDNTGQKYRYYASGNTVIGNVATDNGIHTLQVTGGINASTLSATGTTFSSNLSVSSPSSANFLYVYTGAGANTFTFPTALNNNNIYVIKNYSSMSITIYPYAGQNLVDQYAFSTSSSYTLMGGQAVGWIADGNNKVYRIW
jgi:hypothetical protein